ncbi:hypothetical protein EKN09_08055, partial [Vibrio penaeicida]
PPVDPDLNLEPKKSSGWFSDLESILDTVNESLDYAGQIPGLGIVADLANAGIYAARGQYGNAAISAAGAIPGVGNAATGARIANRIAKRVAGACSFVAGTVIATSVGATPIEDIKVGDNVTARPDTAEQVVDEKSVNAVFQEDHPFVLTLEVSGPDGSEVITTTPEHPFYVDGKGWVDAAALQPGYALTTINGEPVILEDIQVDNTPTVAYNFEVDDYHTYAVGENQVWVHNVCDITKGAGAVKQGIYEFTDTAGKKYVGQSVNIPSRLKQHEKAGKLAPNQSAKTTEVLGGKTAREIAEHKRIQEITRNEPARFSDKVSNKVDPIGPNRRHLLD